MITKPKVGDRLMFDKKQISAFWDREKPAELVIIQRYCNKVWKVIKANETRIRIRHGTDTISFALGSLMSKWVIYV